MKFFKFFPFFFLLLGLQCPRKGITRKVLVPLTESNETSIFKTDQPISNLNQIISTWIKDNNIGDGKNYSSQADVLIFIPNEDEILTIFNKPEKSSYVYETETCFKFYVDIKALGFIPEHIENVLCTQLTSNDLISLSIVRPDGVSREASEIFQKLNSHISSSPFYEFISFGKISYREKLKN